MQGSGDRSSEPQIEELGRRDSPGGLNSFFRAPDRPAAA